MRPGSQAFLASTLALLLISAVVGPDALGLALGLVIGPASIVVVLRSVRRHRPRHPGVWYGLAALGVLFLVAGVVGELISPDHPHPSPADYIDFAAYSVAVATFVTLVAHRNRLADNTSLLEAVILPGGLAVALWNFLTVPNIIDGVFSTEGILLTSAFNLLTLFLCAAIAALVFGPGRREPALYLLSVVGLGALVGDVLASIDESGRGFPGLDHFVLLIPGLAFITSGVAALHPTMTLVTEPTIEPVTPMSRRRMFAISVTAVMAPLFILARLGQNDPWWVTTVTVFIWILTISGIMLRLAGLLRARERIASADRILVAAAEDMMASTTPPAMYRSAIRATTALGAENFDHGRTTILDLTDDEWTIAASDGPVPADAVGTTVLFGADHEPMLNALDGRYAASFEDLAAIDRVGTTAPWATITPLVAADRLRGALLITSSGPLPVHAVATLTALASDLSLALEGVDRAEALHRQRSERRFRSLVENSSDIVTVVDDAGCIEFVTAAITRILGKLEGDVIGRKIEDLVVVEDRARLRASLQLHPSAPISTEIRVLDAAGNARWFDIVASDLRSVPDIAGIVVTARDIHGRKIADERIGRSEARFRSLVQHATDMVALIGEDGTFRYASPSASRVLGYEADELESLELRSVVAERHVYLLGETLGRLESQPGVACGLELDVVTRSGETRTLDVTARDLRHDHAIEGIVVNAHDITDRKQLEQSLRHQALHDGLTGIPNRTLFHDRVEQALAKRASDVAVLVIDLDDFKTVNDGLGHHSGDDLLKVLAYRIRHVVRVGDTAARLGGDEFAILIDDASDRTHACEMADRLLTKIREPFDLSGNEVTVEGSIGIAFSSDLVRPNADMLIRGADAAMYAAKAAGKGRWQLYEESMHLGAVERLHIKTDLAKALGRDEFRLWYQPVIDLDDGHLTGFEALLRWERADIGIVPPNDFIPLAEETGLIIPIGRWVMREALLQLQRWRTALARPDLSMGINVSPRQLSDERLVADVTASIDEADVPANVVIIELTETSRVDEESIEADRLAAIRRLGCHVFADDFGSGYASYAALRRLPFSGVKLDRSLIEGVAHPQARRGRAQVRSMIEMARQLGLEVVAEGIELPEQVQVLRELGCDKGQGYHFARPSPDGGISEDFEQVIQPLDTRAG